MHMVFFFKIKTKDTETEPAKTASTMKEKIRRNTVQVVLVMMWKQEKRSKNSTKQSYVEQQTIRFEAEIKDEQGCTVQF